MSEGGSYQMGLASCQFVSNPHGEPAHRQITTLMPMTTLSQRTRLRGGLFGLLIGDALGVPYEFHSAASIASLSAIEMTPPPTFARAHQGVPPGTWSDDGAQALALFDALLRGRELDLDAFATNLLNWFHRGAFTPDGHVFV